MTNERWGQLFAMLLVLKNLVLLLLLLAELQTKRQLEDDADREIEELKEKYEQRLAAEREVRELMMICSQLQKVQQQLQNTSSPHAATMLL
jgi:hypothetical protein